MGNQKSYTTLSIPRPPERGRIKWVALPFRDPQIRLESKNQIIIAISAHPNPLGVKWLPKLLGHGHNLASHIPAMMGKLAFVPTIVWSIF